MSDLVDPDRIEAIVGAPRQLYVHLARAVSAEQVVYILHGQRCKDTTPDLRDCPWSKALDEGIDSADWPEDQPVSVDIGADGRLSPQLWKGARS